MERSAVYRRALAPLMVVAGVAGLAASGITWSSGIETTRSFAALWMIAAGAVQGVCLLLSRRQALRDHEPFWTLPARRVTAAVLPGFCAGAFAGLACLAPGSEPPPPAFLLVIFWLFCHACALHAAGAFMRRGIRWFAWVIFATALAAGAFYRVSPAASGVAAANLLMGAAFGALHLVFGAYLYLTEPRKNET